MLAEIERAVIVPNYAEAERKANEVLARLRIDDAPVNPIAIANALGYSVNAVVFSDPDISGRTLVRSGDVRIDVNASEPPVRRRFTIAHEIGHAVLHLDGVDSGEISDSTKRFNRHVAGVAPSRPPRESEADRFAGVLLIPEAAARRRFGEDQDIDSLARHFRVSSEAMKIRLQHLHLVP